ncbi:MAG: prenyltransferase/squalene oxidase repeat-containing protein [Aeoliella sp.]
MIDRSCRFAGIVLAVAFLVLGAQSCVGIEPGTNHADEPVRGEISLRAAIDFVDGSAVHWQQTHGCVTCHTNGVYLITRADVGVDAPAYLNTRQFARDYLRQYIVDGEQRSGQRGAVEGIVATTSFLAISDVKTKGKLEPFTRQALDHIWTLQSEDGSWNEWLKCHWGPYEVDDHFGVTLAALAVGMSPDDYRNTPAARAGLEKLCRYLKNHPPASGHQKAMSLWAAQYVEELATQDEQREWTEKLFSLQHDDGGWALIDLGDDQWQREDDKPQDKQSDGYATAFVIYALRQTGIPADDERLQRGLGWLKQNQRQSGRWFTRSPRRDGKHFITQAGTNFAVAALKSMEQAPEVPGD